VAIFTKPGFKNEPFEQIMDQQGNDENKTKDLLSSTSLYFKNEIYHKLNVNFQEWTKVPLTQCNFLYPATEALIQKHSAVRRFLLRETIEMHQQITRPLFIDQIDHQKSNEWLYNILEHKKEVELRVFENDEFITNLDWESNPGDKETL